jgi:hypothetical protein
LLKLLGKACEEEAPNEAVQYFQQVRDLARSGFADSVGLAAASLGLEARIYLEQKKYDRAIEMYLEQWLQAKLLLHDGKIAQAAALLASVARAFPIEPPDTNRLTSANFKDLLSIEAAGCYPELIPAEQQVLGELGVLRLARGEYAQELDALLNAGFWMDAGYIAERVLTADELKAYMDSYWPPASPEQVAEENEKYGQSQVSPAFLRKEIRYLLARRLMRSLRGEEPREYYPPEWTPQYVALVQALKTGWDESLPADQRAKALFEAAVITRTNGMELIGTEVEPDWHVHEGNYMEGVTVAGRATNEAAKVLVASEDELQRTARHAADPEERFHYRYQAASLAWEAAKLMPDNSDETARLLCIAGSWLKYRDPQTANIFYKALVRRNRKTAIGAEADKIRWFPVLDGQGNVIPTKRSRLESSSPPAPPEESRGQFSEAGPDAIASDYPVPGNVYVIHAGDSLATIARAASVFGRVVTVQELLKSNPSLDASRLRIGQKILIPA